MPLDHVQFFHEEPVCPRIDRDNPAPLALLLAGDSHHIIVFLYLHFPVSCSQEPYLPLNVHYSTSGASDMIFMKFFLRSSLATGPKMRVPIGSFWLLISTAAFRSNLMYDPSCRRTSFVVRTTTAFATVPFLTCPSGIAILMATTITSPSDA